MKVRVRITLKPGVLDPEGNAVQRGLSDLGYDFVSEVRTGKLIELDLATEDPDEARRQSAEMCEKLLANPVIESYEIDLISPV